MSFLAQHQVIASANSTLVQLLYDFSSVANYTGDAVVPITADDLPSSVLAKMLINDGSIRAYSDIGKAQELPIEVVEAQPPFCSLANAVRHGPAYIHDTAYYDAASGKTVFVVLNGYMRLETIVRDSSGKWTGPHRIGFGNFDHQEYGANYQDASSRGADVHNLVSIIKDASGAWIAAGGSHYDAFGVWESSAPEGPWTQTGFVDQATTYVNLVRIGDDVLCYWRAGAPGDPGASLEVRGAFQSVSATFQTDFVLCDFGEGGPQHPDGDAGNRTYPIWREVDSAGNVHFLFGLHQDDLGNVSNKRRNHIAYAVLVPTLDGSNHVTSWRWQAIDGTWLAAADTKITWTELNDPKCLLVGESGDTNALLNHTAIGEAAFIATQQETAFSLDDNDRPHMILAMAKEGQVGLDDFGAYDVHAVHWNGTSWTSELVYPSESTSIVYPSYIRADSATDITCIAVRLEKNWTAYTDMALVRLDYDGVSWAETDITPAGAIDPNWGDQGDGTPFGMALMRPAKVRHAPDDGVAVMVPSDPHLSGGMDTVAGGMPIYALDKNGEIIKPNRFFAWVKAPVTSGSAKVYLQYGIEGEALPAVTSTYGRNAVWSDYTSVWHVGNTPRLADSNVYENSGVLDSAGSGNELAWISRLSADPTTIDFPNTDGHIEINENNYLPGVYTGINSVDYATDYGDLPSTWHDFYGNNLDNTGVISVRATPTITEAISNDIVLMVAGWIPEFCTTALAGLRLSITDDNDTNRLLLQCLQSGPDEVTAKSVTKGAAVQTATVIKAGLRDMHCAACVVSSSEQTAILNGDDASGAVSLPNYGAIEKIDVQYEDRGANGREYFGGVICEVRQIFGATAADWTGGRMQIETAAIAALAPPNALAL